MGLLGGLGRPAGDIIYVEISFKEKDYINLLPVDHSKPDNFEIENLLRINDLNKNIFNNKISWKLENDGYIVSKN